MRGDIVAQAFAFRAEHDRERAGGHAFAERDLGLSGKADTPISGLGNFLERAGEVVLVEETETTLRAAQLPGVVAIKEASGNIERAAWLIKHAPAGFSIYSGDDSTAVTLMLLGGHGNVSVTANIAPRAMHELCMAAIAGDVKQAMAIQMKLMPVHKQLFCEANPIPLKWAMARLGLCGETMRLPLTPMSRHLVPQVEAALRDAGLLN